MMNDKLNETVVINATDIDDHHHENVEEGVRLVFFEERLDIRFLDKGTEEGSDGVTWLRLGGGRSASATAKESASSLR